MKNLTRITLIALFLLAIPWAAAQDDSGDTALPLTDEGEQIVASVNGEPITLTEFQHALARNPLPTGDIAAYDMMAEAELNRLIEQAVINQAALTMGVAVTEADIDAEVQAMREIVPDDAEWQEWLLLNGFEDEAQFRKATYDVLVTQGVQERVVIMDSFSVQQVQARHILVATEAEAQAVLQRLLNGEDFAAVASTTSLDETTRSTGGNLGENGAWIVPSDLIVPELGEQALMLQSGVYSQPIETILGWHVVQTLAIEQRPATPQEMAQRGYDIFQEWLQTQIDAAVIERYIYA